MQGGFSMPVAGRFGLKIIFAGIIENKETDGSRGLKWI
jgi:hypothetical protein